MCVVGWWEKCCGDQSKQMDPGPCGTQIHTPGLLTSRITLQPYRVHHWFCFFSLYFVFVSFSQPHTPPHDAISLASFHLGPGWNNHRFPFLAHGVLCQQIWTGEWHQVCGSGSSALYQQKCLNIERREQGPAGGNGHWAGGRVHFWS